MSVVDGLQRAMKDLERAAVRMDKVYQKYQAAVIRSRGIDDTREELEAYCDALNDYFECVRIIEAHMTVITAALKGGK